MGLFSTRHFERCSIHRPSFPRTASPPLSPCSCLSPSRLRGLVSQASGNGAPLGENETPKSSETGRSWTLALWQQLPPSLNVFWGLFFLQKLTKTWPVFCIEYQCKQTLLKPIILQPKRLSGVCGVRGWREMVICWMHYCLVVWKLLICGYRGTLLTGSMICLTASFFPPLSLINIFGGKETFFVEIKIYPCLIDSSCKRVHIQVGLNHICAVQD